MTKPKQKGYRETLPEGVVPPRYRYNPELGCMEGFHVPTMKDIKTRTIEWNSFTDEEFAESGWAQLKVHLLIGFNPKNNMAFNTHCPALRDLEEIIAFWKRRSDLEQAAQVLAIANLYLVCHENNCFKDEKTGDLFDNEGKPVEQEEGGASDD